MPLSDLVNVTISASQSQALQKGFGIPLVLSCKALPAGDRVRFYALADDMLVDGFLTSDAEYLMVSRLLSQNPRPEKVAVGYRLASKAARRFAVTPVVMNSTKYELTVGSTKVSYTSDASATATEIIAGLKTAIDALGLAVTTSDQTTYLRILGNVVGAWFNVGNHNPALLSVKQDTQAVEADVKTDLAAIKLADDSWYMVLSPWTSAIEVDAIADWVESDGGKMFLAQTQDSDVLAGGSSDIASSISALSYVRTALMYSPASADFLDAGLAGVCLPMDPGSETWMGKTVAGVSATSFDSTQLTNLENKRCGWYYTVSGISITQQGKVAASTFIDVVRGRDWFKARTQERVFTRMANAKKIAYTDAGIAIIEGELRAQVAEGQDKTLISTDTTPTYSIPKVASVSAADKSNRVLNNVKCAFTLQGAIHKVNINVNVSV